MSISTKGIYHDQGMMNLMSRSNDFKCRLKLQGKSVLWHGTVCTVRDICLQFYRNMY